MSDPIADAYVQWATEQKPVQPPQEILVSFDCTYAMMNAWQRDYRYGACARAAWPHLFHAWVDGLTEGDYGRFWLVYENSDGDYLAAFRAALRAIGPADPRREGV